MQNHAASGLPTHLMMSGSKLTSVTQAAFPHWKLAMPALQESFLVGHSKAVLDAIKSQQDIATADVLAAVAEVHKALQAVQEAAAAQEQATSGSSGKQRCKAQQDVADVDLELFTQLRQVQCRWQHC